MNFNKLLQRVQIKISSFASFQFDYTMSEQVVSHPSLETLQQAIQDPSAPVGMRMRAAYYLRQTYERNSNDKELQSQVISILGKDGLLNTEHGSLLRHEFAYVMGQLRDPDGCPYLQQILASEHDCIMVRHECSEALGAIGQLNSVQVLEQFANHPRPELSQTCQIAIDFIKWKQSETEDNNLALPPVMACACMLSPYNSVDPAPPMESKQSVEELGEILRDTSLDLFPRYRAMFSLRNINSAQSAIELGKTLVSDTSSALLRHEVAYVLGQMQNEASIPMLIQSLQNLSEHAMVRHESAEALGAMCDLGGDAWQRTESVLRDFQLDQDIVVAESCQVALDAADYWGMWSQSAPRDDPEADYDEDETSRVLSFAAQKNNLPSSNSALLNHFNLVQNQ